LIIEREKLKDRLLLNWNDKGTNRKMAEDNQQRLYRSLYRPEGVSHCPAMEINNTQPEQGPVMEPYRLVLRAS